MITRQSTRAGGTRKRRYEVDPPRCRRAGGNIFLIENGGAIRKSVPEDFVVNATQRNFWRGNPTPVRVRSVGSGSCFRRACAVRVVAGGPLHCTEVHHTTLDYTAVRSAAALYSQMDGAVSLLSLFSILLGLFVSASANVCFWSGSCTNKWVSGCGAGRVKVDQSDDCHGLCPPPRYPPCPLFATHYLCCNEETATPTDDCARYPTRVEVGDDWMCCSDGSQAEVTKHDLKTGFCRSGAQLMIQPKEREVFKWVPREWSACSASCGEGGFRSRLIHCVGRLEHSPKQLYYVNETKCDSSSLLPHQEPCRAKPCSYDRDMHYRERQYRGRHRLPLWAKLIIFFSSSIGTAGLSVGGYILYQRWKERNSNHGFVYVMLDNYS